MEYLPMQRPHARAAAKRSGNQSLRDLRKTVVCLLIAVFFVSCLAALAKAESFADRHRADQRAHAEAIRKEAERRRQLNNKRKMAQHEKDRKLLNSMLNT